MKIYPQLKSAEGIAALLSSEDFTQVYRLADQIRRETVGDIVHLRAIIEFSNICKRQCVYCGLNRENKELGRFRMSREEILEAAAEAVSAGYRTIVLQSGEDDYFTAGRLADIIKSIKEMEVPSEERTVRPIHPAVTISCGERCEEDYRIWKQAGADRYLLKHETADPRIYDELHPCGTLQQRVKCLKILSRLGYETGSGFMVGLPGQTLRTLGEDLLLLKEIPCKMAGIGPFISNPKTPLADQPDGDVYKRQMQLGANHPMGPLALGDLVGLDVCLAIMETLYNEFGDTKYRPHPLLRKMVRANKLGRKTGEGFYDYSK